MRCTTWNLRALVIATGAIFSLALTAPAVAALQLFNDGGSHLVNTSIAPDDIEIRDSGAAVPTTVTVAAGASVGTNGSSSVSVFDNSSYIMTGGVLADELFHFNNSSSNVSGGQIIDDITTNDNSIATVSFVTVDDDLEARGNSVMNISGGNFNEDVESFDTATVNISGGLFQTGTDGANIEADGSSVINIYGGSFGTGETDGAGYLGAIGSAKVNIYGGDISGLPEGLRSEGTAMITIFGNSFKISNVITPPYGPITFNGGSLSGILSDGTAFNVPFSRTSPAAGGPRGAIVLVERAVVPEPGTLILAGLALVAFGAVIRRKG